MSNYTSMGYVGRPLYSNVLGVHKQIGQNWFQYCRVTAAAPYIWSQRLVYTSRLAKTGFYLNCRVTAAAPYIWSQRLVYTSRLAITGSYLAG